MSVLGSELHRTMVLLHDLSGVCVQVMRPVAARHAAEAAERIKKLLTEDKAKEERRRKVIEGLLAIIREGYSADDLLWVEPYAVRMAQQELDS